MASANRWLAHIRLCSSFPLVWTRSDTSVGAVNVTDRYARQAPGRDAQARLDVRVIQPGGKRVIADLTVLDSAAPGTALKGRSRGETADLDDFASFKVTPGRNYHLIARVAELTAEADVTPTKTEGELVTLTLAMTRSAEPAVCPPTPPVKPGTDPRKPETE